MTNMAMSKSVSLVGQVASESAALPHLLLIDADPRNSAVLSQTLSEAGYDVTIASSAEAGVEVARECHPDAILLSQQKEPGRVTQARIRAIPELAAIPLLVLSAGLPTPEPEAIAPSADESQNAIPLCHGLEATLEKIRQTIQQRRLLTSQQLWQRVSELEEANDRLREQDRVKAGFISMVVHDIRSPLTVILGTLDLLNEELGTGNTIDYEHYQHLFQESLRNCREIDHLIEDMLDLARMREHRLRLNFEMTACINIIGEALEVAAGAARHAGITLTSEIQPLLPQVFVDRRQIHRALMNLVNNAIKFTPRGGEVTLRARLLEERRADAPCDYVLLSVSDTGEGLSPEESPYVFDAYWQAPNGKRKTGTGLGLAIVKRIAVAHGGNVSVRSTPGKGSAFTIMVPVRDEMPDDSGELTE
jgi:signal transduction histidine kinase